MPGSLGHLAYRFFDVMTARRLTSAERALVETWLGEDLAEIFFAQPGYDQRHGYEAGIAVLGSGLGEDVIVAAVMHDTGKRHSGLGILGRVVASLLIKFDFGLTERMKLYRDHGITAAAELARRGAPSLAIDYALHHHRTRPPTIDPMTWAVLSEADGANAGYLEILGITSRTR